MPSQSVAVMPIQNDAGHPSAAGATVASVGPKEAAREAALAERGIARLKRNRAVATRYNKVAVRYQATVHIATITEWLLPAS